MSLNTLVSHGVDLKAVDVQSLLPSGLEVSVLSICPPQVPVRILLPGYHALRRWQKDSVAVE